MTQKWFESPEEKPRPRIGTSARFEGDYQCRMLALGRIHANAQTGGIDAIRWKFHIDSFAVVGDQRGFVGRREKGWAIFGDALKALFVPEHMMRTRKPKAWQPHYRDDVNSPGLQPANSHRRRRARV